MKNKIGLPLLLLIFVLSLVFTSFSSPSTKSQQVNDYSVLIDCYWYNPGSLTIPAGSTVVWKSDCGDHTATANDGSWDTGVIKEGEAASVTFNNPGTYFYYCTFHPGLKKGEVVVQ
jgi:plastocyanin